METFFMNSKNSKTNESYKFKYNLIDKLHLKNTNKNMALAKLSIYYTWKNFKSTYNNNKFKISAPTWDKTFDLPDGLLTNLKSGFKREIIWNKYRSQMTTEAINNNLNILIDPTFTNVNRLFVLAYRTADNRQSFSQFYLPNVMVKDFNVIIDKLAFFDLPIKTEEEAYENTIDISRNNEYTTGNLFDSDYFKKHYKLIAIYLSRQQVSKENEDLIQQINFIGRLENAANVFIIIEKKENTILEFSQNLANVIYK